MSKIMLDITPAVAEFAKLHGALYDKEIGWFCFEPVPIELEDFVEAPAKPKNRPDPIEVQCPRCGGQMHLKTSKKGDIFWGCMMYPRCRGTRSVDDPEGS